MWIVAIAWMYVALMMTLAEATAPNGSILGAIITLLLYGIAPLALVMYLLATPARRRAAKAAEAADMATALAAAEPSPSGGDPDASRLAPGDGVSSEREKP
jgi:hypothetical protein